MLIFCSYLKGEEGKGDDEKKDSELKSLNSCDAGQEKGEEKVETEETTPLASKTEKDQNFGERFASFFRLRKTQSMTGEEDVEAGKDTANDATPEEVDTSKASEKKEDFAEEQPDEVEKTIPLTTAKSFGDRFASFFRLRTTQSMTDDHDVEGGKDNAAVEEVDVAKVETELKEVPLVENGEEKGGKDVDEKEKSIIKTKKDMMSCLAGLCNKGGNAEKGEEDESKDELKTDENEKQVKKFCP